MINLTTTPAPPECCPACGAPYLSASLVMNGWKVRVFECGYSFDAENGTELKLCHNAFAAAIALRARAEKAEAEAGALRVSVDNLEHENNALAHLHSQAVDQRDQARAELEACRREVKVLQDQLSQAHADYFIQRDESDAELAQAQAANAEMAGRLATVTEAALFFQSECDQSGEANGEWQTYAKERWGDTWTIDQIKLAQTEARAALDAAKGEAK